ncbi:polysaccharide biosynthesis tyrosine autokinase [Budviciaceae bacterium BWR-B9]|uniref:Polysaccharide biosynthesis tyrosine autokinase n=2 Tax=Budviciaceae TaxID=1903416 RepID=A0ABS1IVU1_9GAMM|nr:polysaccharide biosynthesis tyrosine autokinase [Limnobaculum allomyrinae]MBV7693759.1 polysaccharide biosynthesis tyrosine autokinase [Limnobaculum sp. M2-1]
MTEKHELSNEKRITNNEVDLTYLLGIALDYKWLIFITLLIFAVCGTLYAFTATPIYKADALVQIEQRSSSNMLGKLSEMLPDNKSSSAPEIEVLKSRMILGKTVRDLNLDILVKPQYFLGIGKKFSQLFNIKKNKISITQLEVPDEWINKEFILKVISENSYEINIDDLKIEGRVGDLINKSGFTILVNSIKSEPNAKFEIKKLSELSAINSLSERYDVFDKTKDNGILQLTLEGEDQNKISEELNSITYNYLSQNIVRKSEEAAKSLDFLNSQISVVKANLDEAENNLNKVRQENVSIDLPLEAKSTLDAIVSVESQLKELTLNEAEISKLYTKDHPSYRALLEKRTTLKKEKEILNKRISDMPKTQQEILRLTQDVQSGQDVYMLLLNKQQELSINKASTVGNVRIIDSAVTQPKAIAPKKVLIILASILLGMLVSFCIIVTRVFLNQGIESTETIEDLGINVYATVPVSTWLINQNNTLKKRGTKKPRSNSLLVTDNPTDISVEAIRNLQAGLHFALFEASNKILMFTSATPEVGKTFISCNLAAVMAQSGKKILFIDSDMRRGEAHYILEGREKNGLSELLSGQISITDAIQSIKINGLDFISRGEAPSNSSELLFNEKLNKLLVWANENYDLIIIDTPPVLAVADASIVGKYAGTSMLVTRFQKTTLKDLKTSIRRLEQYGIKIKGAIFNGLERKSSNSYEYNTYKDYL